MFLVLVFGMADGFFGGMTFALCLEFKFVFLIKLFFMFDLLKFG